MPNANRVFIPKEELSLDIIKQYKVVGDPAAPVLCTSHHSRRSKTAGRVWGGQTGMMGVQRSGVWCSPGAAAGTLQQAACPEAAGPPST